MSDLYVDFESDELEEVDEDAQVAEIEKLTDPEEIEAAKEIILDELEEPGKQGTSSKDSETEPEQKTDKAGTSGEQDKTQQPTEGKEKPAGESGKENGAEVKGFVLTEAVINSQPEEVRGLLNKYKDKGKEEIAKAVANAIIFKQPHLNKAANKADVESAIAKSIMDGSDEQILQALIDTQKETGAGTQAPVTEKPSPETEDNESGSEIPKELPPLPEDNEEVKKVVSGETIKRLRQKYGEDLPEDFNSLEFKEWLRDLQDANLEKAYEFIQDKQTIGSQVKTDLQKAVYFQDNHIQLNNARLKNEVAAIKAELEKFGVTDPKEIGVDLTLVKEESGRLYNPILNSLMLNSGRPDPNIIRYVGKIPLLQKGQLAEKFIYKHTTQLMSHLVNKKATDTQKEVERVKAESLNTLGGSSTSGPSSKGITLEEIAATTDTAKLTKAKEDLLNSFQ